ncbi:Hypothetical protein CINCED_3A002247 [Cinara cedri]|uniref:Uncharacterized protein n=1 Tax=Cinara cedri TaxID=506608 RepID=A0A5E4NHX6_9HEMI|nr:Hypothetical protein CINCED_3A002247 [Cinara cedri]
MNNQSSAEKVGEIFSAAGIALGRLGELTITLQPENDIPTTNRSQIHATLKRKSYESRALINPAALTRTPMSTSILSAKCNSADVTLNMLNAPQEHNSGSDDISIENIRHDFNCSVDIE